MKINYSKFRLLFISIATLICCIYIFRPIYLTNPFRLGVICQVCGEPSANDFIAIKLAGNNVVSLGQVMATPLESVTIENQKITVNQVIIDLELPKHFNYPLKDNSTDEYFVLIYDRSLNKITDFGRIKKTRLLGKVILIW